MGMTHIGPQKYFDICQAVINAHRGVVLYEGVGIINESELSHLSSVQRRIYEDLITSLRILRLIVNTIGWTTQDELKRSSTWIRGDIDFAELVSEWERRSIPYIELPSEDNTQVILTALAKHGFARDLLFGFLWTATRFWESFSAVALGAEGEVLEKYRNNKALAVFDTINPRTDVLILYGMAHLKGLAEGLFQRGYTVESRRRIHHCSLRPNTLVMNAVLQPFIVAAILLKQIQRFRGVERIAKEGYPAIRPQLLGK